MHSLFWKIFAAFWTTVVLLLFTMMAVEWIIPLEPPGVSHQALMRDALQSEARTAALALKAGGADGLNAELESFESRTEVDSYWLDKNGNEPPETAFEAPVVTPLIKQTARLAGAAPPGSPPLWRVVGLSIYAGVKAPFGNSVLVVRLNRVDLPNRGRSRVIRVVLTLAIAGVACWLLARHLVAPIEALRRASQQLAAGDLRARVTPAPKPRRRDEIALLSHDFDVMAGQLQYLVDAQKTLLQDVSHELRSPLTRLRLTLALMNRQMPSEVAEQLASQRERIEAEMASLDSLIGELLTLSRLENRLDLPKADFSTSVDLIACLRKIESDLLWEVGQGDKSVTVSFETEMAAANILGEKALLTRAISNLVFNALRYVPDGGSITLSLKKENDRWQISVMDDGPGVPNEELEAIFQPFYRVENGGQLSPEDGPRSGLGLAIARRAIGLHGGILRAINREPHGLRMQIELPGSKDQVEGALQMAEMESGTATYT